MAGASGKGTGRRGCGSQAGSTPRATVGSTQTAVLQAVGRKLTVKINGATVATFTDSEKPYRSGAVGLYCEDAAVTFSRISVTAL